MIFRSLKFLAFILFAVLQYYAANAQNLTIGDSTSRWKLGLNTGLAFQQADVKTNFGYGYGATLELAMIQNSHSAIGMSLRARYLFSNTYGKALSPTSGIANNPALNGQYDPAVNYMGQGPVYMNYRAKVHDIDLELMLIANRLRQKGVLLYTFGGVGLLPYKVYTDQLDRDGNMYNYAQITGPGNGLVRNQLNGIRDKVYETRAEHTSSLAFAPSVGVGIGFYAGPHAVWGFEHKVTFPHTDLLDGQRWTNSNQLTGNNDIHHYTNFFLRLDLGGGGGRVRSVRNNSDNYTVVSPKPEIYINNPVQNPATGCTGDVQATIRNVYSKSDIIVRQDGMILDPSLYIFTPSTGILSFTIPLQHATAFSITARNAEGAKTKYVNFNCNQVSAPPVIRIMSPAVSPAYAPGCNASLAAQIDNIIGTENIELRENGYLVPPNQYSYNPVTHILTLNTPFYGTATFSIVAINSAGSASASAGFTCHPVTTPPPAIPRPVIVINRPYSSHVMTSNCVADISATISNIESKYNIEVRQNGLVINGALYNYNPVTDEFTLRVPITGINNFTISASNASGRAISDLSIGCQPPRLPDPAIPAVPAPVITITNPGVNPYVSPDCIANINAVILNIDSKNNIEVRQNGQLVSSTLYTYDSYSRVFHLTSPVSSLSNFSVNAVNATGNASANVTIKCEPQQPQQPAVQKPAITVTNPVQNPYVSPDCKAGITAFILNIDGKQNLEVRQNGQILSSGLYSYDPASKMLALNTDINGVTVFTLTAANIAGTASTTINIKCEPAQNPVPVVQKPAIKITSPAQDPYTDADCKAAITALISNIQGEENIEVRQNGQIVSPSLYTYDAGSGYLNINMDIHGVTAFSITAVNTAGTATASRTIKCSATSTPQPVVAPPVITVTSPAQNPYVSVDCKAAITATITNIDNDNNIDVRQNGQQVSTALFHFDAASKIFTLQTDIKEVTVFSITAANTAGSSSASVTVKCQPPVTQSPVVEKPVVTINNPTQNPYTSPDCKAAVTASITNINSESNIDVRQNGQVVSTALYHFDPVSGTLTLNTDLREVTVFTITAANSAGSGSATVTINCAANVTEKPVLQKPAITITTPSQNPYVASDCKSAIQATILNIDNENNIEVQLNGDVLASALYHFDLATHVLTLNTDIKDVAVFTIIAANAAGSTSVTTTIKCAPATEQQPVVQKPVILITSPAQNPYTAPDCKAAITASITNIDSENNIDVRQNGQIVANALYHFDPASKTLVLNTDIHELTVFSITAANSAGSASAAVTINCAPAIDQNPVVQKPVITIISPSQNPSVSEDCKANIQAAIQNIDNENNIDVRMNGNSLSSALYHFDPASHVLTLNTDITDLAAFTITAANAAGSASAATTIRCQPKVVAPPVEKPLITIVTPVQSPYIAPDCKSGISATIANIAGKENIEVRQNGQILPANLYTYDAAGNSFALNMYVPGEANFTITAVNSAGSTSAVVSVECKSNVNVPTPTVDNCGCNTVPVAASADYYNNVTPAAAGAGNISVGSGQKALIAPGQSFSGNVDMNGGMLVIGGTADIGNINFNAGEIIILGGATFRNINANNSSSAIRNFGNASFSNVTFNGLFENNGTASVNQDFNINSSATFRNTGTLNVSGSLNNSNQVVNTGVIQISNKLQNNGGAQFSNACHLSVSADLINNSSFTNSGTISVSATTLLNSGTFNMNGGSRLVTGNLTLNGAILGDATYCAFIKVNSRTLLNSGASISGKAELCDESGIETNSLQYTSSCGCQAAPCNNGAINLPDPQVPTYVAPVTSTPPAEEEKITICHYPPGNTANPQTITIPKSALQAHLDHGDKIGTCPAVTDDANAKITICHYPPGNTDNPQTITIPKSALQAHLDHGDKIGTCPSVPDNSNSNGPVNNGNNDDTKKGNDDGQDDANAKITICHYPPGNTANPQTITIPKSALQAHLDHGDKIGTCPSVPDNSNSNGPVNNGNSDDTKKGNDDGQDDANAKITICHYPPGNTDNPQTITIPKSALKAHLDHGDKIGPCDVPDNKNQDKDNNGNGNDKSDKQGNDPKQDNDNSGKSQTDIDQAKQQAEQDRLKKEADEKARQQAEQDRLQKEADEKARQQAEQDRLQKEADDKARQQAEQDRLQKEADDKARQQAEQDRLQKEADDKARQQAEQDRLQKEADDKARQQAEQDRLQKEADDKARQQAEQDRLQKEADDKARQQAEQDRLQKEADDKARQQAEQDRLQKEADDKARQQAEQDRLKKEADDKARQQAEQDRLKKEADEKARQQAEQDKSQKDANDSGQDDQKQKGGDDDKSGDTPDNGDNKNDKGNK